MSVNVLVGHRAPVLAYAESLSSLGIVRRRPLFDT